MAARQESREGRASVRLDFGCGRAVFIGAQDRFGVGFGL
jgi:hypothetical protein